MWSEEELRDIPDPAPEPRLRSRSNALRQTLAHLNAGSTHPHEQTRSSIIYSPVESSHGNFLPASYKRILADPAWASRLHKAHSAKRKARPTGPQELTREWRELDTATSSDALLMNIFCYPRVLAGKRLTALLGIDRGEQPVFGYHPETPKARNLQDRTEVDMRLGNLLVEAKLTEADFQAAPLRLLEQYTALPELFHVEHLPRRGELVEGYQLVRGVLAAHHLGCRFAVMLDARRPELLAQWGAVMGAVRSYEVRARLRVWTWQEIAGASPKSLQGFLAGKYGIVPE